MRAIVLPAIAIFFLATTNGASSAPEDHHNYVHSYGYSTTKYQPRQLNRRVTRNKSRTLRRTFRRTVRRVIVAGREFKNAQQVIGIGGSLPHHVAAAQRWIGYRPSLPELKQWGAVTGARWVLNRVRLHCAIGLNMVLASVGLPTTRSNLARSFYSYGSRASGPAVGTIYVQKHHVALVVGISARGNPLVLGFNQGRGLTTVIERQARSGTYRWPPGAG